MHNITLTPAWATVLAAVIGFAGLMVPKVWGAVLGAWRKPSSPAENATAQASKAETEWKITQGLLTSLQGEVARLSSRVTELEALNDQCRGENRQLWQRIDSLEALLRREGIPVTERELPNTFVVMEGEHRTVFKPENRKTDKE